MPSAIFSRAAGEGALALVAKEAVGEPPAMTPQRLVRLIDAYGELADILSREWTDTREEMADVVEAGRLRRLLNSMTEAADSLGKAEAVLRSVLCRLKDASPQMGPRVQVLDAARDKVEAVRRGAAELAPPMAAPRVVLPTAPAAGPYETGDSILARLRAGEDV
jgi:hypothetical protein